MLNAYVKRPLTRERYHSSPVGPHLDAFVLWLEQREYQPRRILRLIRGVHRFSQWAHDNGLGIEELDARHSQTSSRHLVAQRSRDLGDLAYPRRVGVCHRQYCRQLFSIAHSAV